MNQKVEHVVKGLQVCLKFVKKVELKINQVIELFTNDPDIRCEGQRRVEPRNINVDSYTDSILLYIYEYTRASNSCITEINRVLVPRKTNKHVPVPTVNERCSTLESEDYISTFANVRSIDNTIKNLGIKIRTLSEEMKALESELALGRTFIDGIRGKLRVFFPDPLSDLTGVYSDETGLFVTDDLLTARDLVHRLTNANVDALCSSLSESMENMAKIDVDYDKIKLNQGCRIWCLHTMLEEQHVGEEKNRVRKTKDKDLRRGEQIKPKQAITKLLKKEEDIAQEIVDKNGKGKLQQLIDNATVESHKLANENIGKMVQDPDESFQIRESELHNNSVEEWQQEKEEEISNDSKIVNMSFTKHDMEEQIETTRENCACHGGNVNDIRYRLQVKKCWKSFHDQIQEVVIGYIRQNPGCAISTTYLNVFNYVIFLSNKH